MDRERTQFADNSLQYQMSLSALSGQIKGNMNVLQSGKLTDAASLNIFDIAGQSALTAQSQRLNVAASNLANADSVTGPDGQPYRAKQVVFQQRCSCKRDSGVKVARCYRKSGLDKLVYEPGNPLMDAKGYGNAKR